MAIEELYNILLSDNASTLIRDNEEEIFKLIPELKVCKGFNQNNEWHIYDVYEHIMHVIDNVSSDIVIRLAALFHDIGKPLSYKQDENKVGHFKGHWEESQRIFSDFSKKYNIDKDISEKVSNLIYYHDINISKLDDNELDKIIDIFGKDGILRLYELKRADLLAQNEKFHYILEDYKKQLDNLLKRW